MKLKAGCGQTEVEVWPLAHSMCITHMPGWHINSHRNMLNKAVACITHAHGDLKPCAITDWLVHGSGDCTSASTCGYERVQIMIGSSCRCSNGLHALMQMHDILKNDLNNTC